MGETYLYIISIVLQVSGALLLIVKWCASTEKLIKEEYFRTDAALLGEGDENGFRLHASEENLERVLINIYINRMAFVYIFLGYLLGVLGGVSGSRWCLIAYIFSISIILTCFSNFVIKKIAHKNSKLNEYKKIVEDDRNVPNGAIMMVPQDDNFK